jgi:WD40 repeat protein
MGCGNRREGIPAPALDDPSDADLGEVIDRESALRALNTLKSYRGKELKDLEADGDEPRRLYAAIKSLIPNREYRGFFDYVPWHIWEFTKQGEEPSYTLFEANTSLPQPGSTRIRITLLDSMGQVLSETQFDTGHRCYMQGVKLESLVEGEYPAIVLETGSGFGPGPDVPKQYYARIGNRIDLVRIENSARTATRNTYYRRHDHTGPPIPVQTAAEWESDLRSRNRLKVLRALVWLGGVHWELRPGESADPQMEDVQQVRLVRKLRKRPAVLARLRELVNGKEEWERQAAQLALDPEDRRLTSFSSNRTTPVPPGPWLFGQGPIRTVPAFAATEQALRKDAYGDPLPPGALLRLGTIRFRHGTWIEAVSYSPDGRTIAAGDDGGTIRLWDAKTGTEIWNVQLHRTVRCLAFAPDGKLLASAGPSDRSEALILLDARTGQEKHRVPSESGEFIGGVEFSRDGKLLAVAIPNDHVVRFLDGSSYKELSRIKASCRDPSGLTLSPDGSLFASKGPEGTISIWESASGKEVKQLPNTSESTAVRFSPNGKLLAVGGSEINRIFRVTDWQEQSQFKDGRSWISSLVFSRDESTLLEAGADGKVRTWNVATGKQGPQVGKYTGSVTSMSLSPDETTLAVGSYSKGALHLYDVATGNEVPRQSVTSGVVRAASLSPDGKIAAIAVNAGDLLTWDVSNNRLRWSKTEPDEFIGDLAFSPDGMTLAVGSSGESGGKIALRDVETGRLVRSWNAQFSGSDARLAYSPDGLCLTGANLSKKVSVSDVKDGKVRFSFSTTDRWVWEIAFAPGGNFLATASTDGTLRIWDAADGSARRSFPEYTDGVSAFAYSPTGMMIATSGRGGSILLSEAASGKARTYLNGAGDSVTALAFGPDGTTLAAGNSKGSVRLFDLFNGKEWRCLDGHRGAVRTLQFSNDGRILLSGSDDTTALVWDMSGLSKNRGTPAPDQLSREGFDALWNDLTSDDAGRSFTAILRLARVKESAPLIKARLSELNRSWTGRQEQIRKAIAALNSDQLKVREKALAELKNMPDESEPWLLRLLASNPPVEIREEIDELLETTRSACPVPETLTVLRALEVLEIMATPESREALHELSMQELPQSRLAQEAQGSLKRIEKRLKAAN